MENERDEKEGEEEEVDTVVEVRRGRGESVLQAGWKSAGREGEEKREERREVGDEGGKIKGRSRVDAVEWTRAV